MSPRKSQLVEELAKFSEALWIELPFAASMRLAGQGDENGLREAGWKAYDVNIDGISYVKSYREDFGAQIEQKGIESVIARLQKGEKPASIQKTTDKPS